MYYCMIEVHVATGETFYFIHTFVVKDHGTIAIYHVY